MPGAPLHRFGQLRQRLALGLGHQAEDELGELFEMPDVMKDRAIMSTIGVDEGDRVVGGANAGYGGQLLIETGMVQVFLVLSLQTLCPT